MRARLIWPGALAILTVEALESGINLSAETIVTKQPPFSQEHVSGKPAGGEARPDRTVRKTGRPGGPALTATRGGREVFLRLRRGTPGQTQGPLPVEAAGRSPGQLTSTGTGDNGTFPYVTRAREPLPAGQPTDTSAKVPGMDAKERAAERHAVTLRLLAYRDARATRDDDMRLARELGIPVTEIAEMTGMVRQHVSGIIHGTR